MLVWNDEDTNARVERVFAIGPSSMDYPVRTISDDGRIGTHCCKHCAEIPKQRRATWKELAYWLIDGKGLVVDTNSHRVDTGVYFNDVDLGECVSDFLKVMRRDDIEWHEPTIDYMGIKG